MLIVTDSMPRLKESLAQARLSAAARLMVLRMVLAFVLHVGRMSCAAAATAIASATCHRAQLPRFLAQQRWKEAELNDHLRRDLLTREAGPGLYLFLIDATLTSQSGTCTTNTFSTGNRQRRAQAGRRYGKHKHAPKRCHRFTCGLLITPSGARIPFCKPYHTHAYCQQHRRPHCTDAQLAAQLIDELPVQAGGDVRVIVLGDSAYEAKVVRQACARRNYTWIFPSNCERVYAGPRGARPRLRAALKDWSSWPRQTIEVVAHRGPYAVYRRLSAARSRPNNKPRTYYVHAETATVHSVGAVQLVHSTTKANLIHATADDVKILMTNDLTLSAAQIVELYALRWQIELFFKELKSTLGFDQYQFLDFESVEGWCELALTTFLYLESYRAEQLQRADLSAKQQRWWLQQRCHGLCQAVRLASAQQQLHYIAEQLQSAEGIENLKALLRASFVSEYRAPL